MTDFTNFLSKKTRGNANKYIQLCNVCRSSILNWMNITLKYFDINFLCVVLLKEKFFFFFLKFDVKKKVTSIN